MILERRTEELGPVDTLFALLEEELDIVRISERQVTLLGLVFLGMLPALGICPKCVTLLEILSSRLFLERLHLTKLRRVLHAEVVLEIRRVVQPAVFHHNAGLEALLETLYLAELIRVAECEESLKLLILERLAVTADTAGRNQTLESQHLTTLVRIFVLTVHQRLFALLEIGTLHYFLEGVVLRQLRRFLNLAPSLDACL